MPIPPSRCDQGAQDGLFTFMSEKSQVTNILGKYEDQDRLRTLFRLAKNNQISEEEFVQLVQGDRNYFAQELINDLVRDMRTHLPDPYTYRQPIWTTGIGVATTTSSPYYYTSSDKP